MGVVYIYGLQDPRDGVIHYIGQTSDLQGRFKAHLQREQNAQKGAWLADLQANGLVPEMVVLEQSTPENWPAAERTWIERGRELGWPLTNVMKGGEGSGAHFSQTEPLEPYIDKANLYKFRSLPLSIRQDLAWSAAVFGLPYFHDLIMSSRGIGDNEGVTLAKGYQAISWLVNAELAVIA